MYSINSIYRIFAVGVISGSAIWAQSNQSAGLSSAAVAGVGAAATPLADAQLSDLQTKANTSFGLWKKTDGGGEFHAGLTYVNGGPVLMLVTTPGENASRLLNRKRSIVLACDFLLDDVAFQEATLCVVEFGGKRPQQQALTNYKVRRSDFQRALKKAAPSDTAKGAVQKARGDDTVTTSICAELGIK